ncbi:hypothetical protein JOC33_003473 [Thalassobacillus pellis]|nr:hypothetical protein [Thalassobacillus pellis]
MDILDQGPVVVHPVVGSVLLKDLGLLVGEKLPVCFGF